MRHLNKEDLCQTLQEASALFEKASHTSLCDTQAITMLSLSLSNILLTIAQREITETEKDRDKIITKAIRDPNFKYALLFLTDCLFRSEDYSKTASLLLEKKDLFLSIHALSFFEKTCIRIVLSLLYIAPKSGVILLQAILRSKIKRIIYSRSNETLYEVLGDAERDGIVINIHRLAGSVLGKEGLNKHLDAYIDHLNNPLIKSVSIHLSALFGTIPQVGFHEVLPKIRDTLTILLKKAQEAEQKPSIIIDMEGFRNLNSTIQLIESLAEVDEIKHAEFGVVIQAYIPESSEILIRLISASKQRIQNGGTPLYVKLVKGANILKEKFEASLENWPQALYHSKEETDAHFLRLLSQLMLAIKGGDITGGVATHNIFNIAYSIILSKVYGVEKGVSYEMLNGMAPSVSRAVHKLTGNLRLECAISEDNDVTTTMSHLLRGLDENLSKEYFLPTISTAILGENALWKLEKAKFLKSIELSENISTRSLRQSKMCEHIESSRVVTDKLFIHCPNSDWALPENMQKALETRDEWKEKAVTHFPLIIQGTPIQTSLIQTREDPSIPKKIIHSYSLATEEILYQTINTMADIHQKRKTAGWTWTIDEQISFLLSLADQITRRRFDFIGSMLREIAKPITEADSEVTQAIDTCRYYAHLLMKERHFLTWKRDKHIALVAAPWNNPLSLSLRHILQAILSGHAVLFKPAPEGVATGAMLFESIIATGIDPSIIAFIPFREAPEGIRFLSDNRIDSLFLTGSTETAKLFMRLSKNKSIHAEASSKNCAFLSSLSDKELALEHIIESAFSFSGQKCNGLGLLILDETLFSSTNFLNQLRDAVGNIICDSAWNLAATVTPLARKPSKSFLKATHNLEQGESWILPPYQCLDNPNLFYPSIKKLTEHKTFSHTNELVGPCLSIISAKNIPEALEIMHMTQYGHTSAIYTLSYKEQSEWINKSKTANVFINKSMTKVRSASQPLGGGWKASSFGIGIKPEGPFSLRTVMASHVQYVDITQSQESKKISFPLKGEILTLLGILKTTENISQIAEFVSYARNAHTVWIEDFAHQRILLPSIVGEENFITINPHERLVLIAHELDDPLMIWAAIVMAAISKCRLIFNKTCVDILKPYINIDILSSLMKKWHWFMFEESSRTAMRLLSDIEYPRIRAFREIDSTLLNFISEQACTIEMEPFCLDPRIDFLSFIKEKAISHEYHRYGNTAVVQISSEQNIEEEYSQIKEIKVEETHTQDIKV